MEMTTLKQLIDFNDKLIYENGNQMTAYEIHQKVIPLVKNTSKEKRLKVF